MALKGIRVVEMAGLAPAPFCGMILADFGAKVTRIDRAPKKDQTVIVNMDTLARGKQSVSVDLKKPEGVEVVRKLCSKADVIIEPFRKGVMEKLGLGPEVLLGVNPRLVYARLTGFGQNGPLSHKAGHDINYIAISGVLSQLGRKHENPAPPINLAADFAGGGLTCALGIALALYERTMSGKGQVIDANMVNGSAYLSTFLWTSRAMPMIWGNGRGENRLDGGSAFYETYKTKDGKYVSVGALEPQFYADLLTAMDVIRAASSLEDLRSRCGLKFPDRIYATNLRKHCATIAQVIGLKDHEMKWLCRHLGHTRKVHEQHYRSTSGLIERLDIAKLMLIQESNLHGKFSGKSLNEISFEDILQEDETEVAAPVNDIRDVVVEVSVTGGDDLAVEDYMNDDGVDILQTRKKVKKRLGLTKKDVPQLSDPEAMKEKFTEIFLTKTRDEWTEIFKDLDACFAPILEMDEAPGHPHNVETQTFISSVDGKVEPAPAPKLSRTPGVGRVLAQPEVGEHTVSRLLEDGFSKAEVDNLIKSGVLFQNNDMSKL